ALLEAADEARHERQDLGLEHREHALAAVLGHDLVKARVLLVGNAATAPEAFDDIGLDAAEPADVLGVHRDVAGPRGAREGSRMLGGQLRVIRGNKRTDVPMSGSRHWSKPALGA